MATIATVTAAVQATWGSDKSKLSKDKLQNPTEWYVADDPMSRTRYFIIQGSDTLDHWKVNLTFDPVVFEDPSLGVKVSIASALFSLEDTISKDKEIPESTECVKRARHSPFTLGRHVQESWASTEVLVTSFLHLDGIDALQVHRGVYEAAKLLYDRYKPMVEEHLVTSPFAKIAFVGHSLGGSLGSLLMLMFLHRGVVPISAISPTYTFGAPAIFCEASGPGGTCALGTSAPPKALPEGKPQSSAGASVSSRVSRPSLPERSAEFWAGTRTRHSCCGA